jgi:hypothetical protein
VTAIDCVLPGFFLHCGSAAAPIGGIGGVARQSRCHRPVAPGALTRIICSKTAAPISPFGWEWPRFTRSQLLAEAK